MSWFQWWLYEHYSLGTIVKWSLVTLVVLFVALFLFYKITEHKF